MIPKLSQNELRVLGCLLEKEMTTPDYYPMTINSLKAACNQKSNRDPVLELSDNVVMDIVSSLSTKHYVLRMPLGDGRVPKYAHRITALHALSVAELAILAELFLRGPQTLGELRTRCQRMTDFNSLDDVQKVIEHLMDEDFGPFVVRLDPQPGKREQRYAHLFTDQDHRAASAVTSLQSDDSGSSVLDQLRLDVESLKGEVENLKLQIKELKGEV